MIPTTLLAAPDDPAAFPESGIFWPRGMPGEVMVADDGKSSGAFIVRRLGLDIAHLLEAPSKSGNLSEDPCFSSLAQRGYS
jgi:hypothetical protein